MTTDNPIKQWIEERRAIHEAATEGPWVAECSGETGDCVIPHDAQSTREAVAVTRLFHRTADANAVADAHTNLPRALDALNAVLELHEPISGFEGDPSHWECKVRSDDRGPKPWPCPTVQAIEGAIND